jgi:hypothetical protein
MRQFKILVAALVMATVAAVGWAGPAQAASFSCNTGLHTACNTVSAAALDATVDINIYVPDHGACSYRVRDTNNWQIVRSGSFSWHHSSTIYGLYSFYRLEVWNCSNWTEATIIG